MFLNPLNFFVRHVLLSALTVSRWKESVIGANRKYIYPEESSAETSAFKKKLYKNLSEDAAGFLTGNSAFKKLPASIGEYPFKNHGSKFSIDKDSMDILEKMKKGGLMLTAHFGDYEAMGPWLCQLGIPLAASYSKIKPALLNTFLESALRSVNGYSYSTFIRNPKDILKLIDAHNLFCLLADQDYRKSSAIHTEFLGKPVNCNPIPSFIFRHRPLTPVYICWIDKKLDEYILHARSLTIEKEDDAIQKFNAWLGEKISEDGSKWYGWSHRRFKSSVKTYNNIY